MATPDRRATGKSRCDQTTARSDGPRSSPSGICLGPRSPWAPAHPGGSLCQGDGGVYAFTHNLPYNPLSVIECT